MRRRIFGWAWPLALLGLAAQPTAAEDAPTRDTAVASLDALLEPVRARPAVPALTAIVISSRGTLARGTVGVRKRGAPTKVGADDLWHLGSCTKTMTATLIGRLVDQKKLRFDLTLGEAFPKLAKTMHADWKAVTLDLLLRNRSGMPADLGRDGLWGRLYAHQGTPREAR
ncbi:MAG: serine hydrolase, partial [Planctomycetota bacterium]|nr:serine hydrolase [Planctomycetota bacterium]